MTSNSDSEIQFNIDCDTKNSLLTITIHGVVNEVTFEDVINAVQKKLKEHFFERRLYDMTKAELELTVDQHEHVLNVAKEKLAAPQGKHRIAFVSDDLLTRDLLRIFKYQSYAFQFSDMHIFESIEEAREWLFED